MDDHRVEVTGAAQNAAPVSLSHRPNLATALLGVAAIVMLTATVTFTQLPTHTTADTTDPRPNMRYACDDFTSQDEAQWWFDQWKEQYPELLRLDGDNNGIPCQNLPTLQDIQAVAQKANFLERLR